MHKLFQILLRKLANIHKRSLLQNRMHQKTNPQMLIYSIHTNPKFKTEESHNHEHNKNLRELNFYEIREIFQRNLLEMITEKNEKGLQKRLKMQKKVGVMI